jgi:hypothetical protein
MTASKPGSYQSKTPFGINFWLYRQMYEQNGEAGLGYTVAYLFEANEPS